jgi:hypothetical protein
MDLAGTWNTTGTPTLIKANVTNTASNPASLLMDLQVNTVSYASISRSGSAMFGGTTLSIGSATNTLVLYNAGLLSWASTGGALNNAALGDLILGRRGTANLRFGAADAAAPVPQFLSVQSVVAGTSNTAGANLTITGSQGTGTGAGGSIIFQVAPAGSSGTAQNALATALTITGAGKVLLPAGSVSVSANLQTVFNGYDTTGLGTNGTNLAFWLAAVLEFNLSNNSFRVRRDSQFGFSSSTSNNQVADTGISRAAAGTIKITDGSTGTGALESASLKTDAPTGGTAATWKLGTVASVTPTLQNRTIEVDIGGTIYYISAKTTND